MNQFPEESKEIKDCVHYVAENKEEIEKTVDNIMDNERQIKDAINEKIEGETIRDALHYALDNKDLTKNAIKVGLGAAQYADENCIIY